VNTRVDNTVYGFHSNITGTTAAIYDFTQNSHPILTIFDSGGNDTLDVSGWTAPADLSLVAGAYSSCNGMTANIAIAYGCQIENAVGGGGDDLIFGNAAANHIDGGAGDDILCGGDGNDLLTGGTGDDVIFGGGGSDTAVFSGSFSTYSISYDVRTD